MKFIYETLGKLTFNLDNKRIPLNSSERSVKKKIGLYPYFGANNILDYIDEYIFDEKILCIAEDGGSWGGQQRCAYIVNEKCWVNNHAHVLKENGKAHLEYLYFYLNYSNLNKYITGTTRGKLTRRELEKIVIPLPPSIDDQKRIAKVLSQCETLIQKRKESIDLLDELLRSTFLEMFGDPVKNEKGWDIVSLTKFGTIDRGLSKHRPRNAPELLNGNHPLIQTGDVANAGTYILDYKQTYSDVGLKQSKKWPAGTLCITIAANIAKTGILTFDACFPDSIVGFVVDSKEATNLYVHHLFSFFQRILEKNAPSAAQKNINLEILRTFKVPQPSLEVQQEFDIIALKVESLKRQLKKSLKEFENLFGSISQRVFKGELDLSKVDISDMEDSKKKDLEEVKENLSEEQIEHSIRSFEHTLPTGEVPANREVDIRSMTIRQYLGLRERDEATEGVEFAHMNKDFFYQFILKDGFTDGFLTIQDVEQYARKYILNGTGFEFTYDNWKTIIFRFIEAKQPLIEQIFDGETKTIKLKLTNEAFKV